ncbi:hypothetical protein LEP1GSC047_1045 [Leptospira inadai serovar Lyme str. 10]|uniref:Uncharacterized protein n=1 Tax=Leptospira inadai serovar Lyme str. 10 TaxID=1049790 RepID=V6H7S9_9LEPT|nr:hypothetical protein LEP1GSC047_1045 [Leptospira inadai serovar Lyme str. 10]
MPNFSQNDVTLISDFKLRNEVDRPVSNSYSEISYADLQIEGLAFFPSKEKMSNSR